MRKLEKKNSGAVHGFKFSPLGGDKIPIAVKVETIFFDSPRSKMYAQHAKS